MQVADSLTLTYPKSGNYQRTKARALYNLADCCMESGQDLAKAKPFLDASLSIMKPFADSDQPGRTDRLEVIMVLNVLGTLLNGAEGSPEAAEPLRESIQRADALLAADTGNPDLRFLRSAAQHELGRSLSSTDPTAALPHLNDAVRTFQQLTQESPVMHAYDLPEAQSFLSRGVCLIRIHQEDAGRDDLLKARERLKGLLESSPTHPLYCQTQASILTELADLSLARGNVAEARDLTSQVAKLHQTAIQSTPDHPKNSSISRKMGELLRRLEANVNADSDQQAARPKEDSDSH